MSTKKLAKELGLVRQRSQSSNGLKKSLVSNQTFSYLIVIDFESTCWREKNNYGQEIIEFPAVLLNTSTGEVESEFHAYVQPQEHPTLSEFCTELTGITQTQVEAGIPLRICLSRFSRWLQNLQLDVGVVFPDRRHPSSASSPSQKLCTFLTWSDWDLGVCLQYECKRKQLHKPDVLNSWIDLRSTYRLFYDRKPKGLNGALQDLGIQFSGREHSGLDDARNTAQLAARMMRDGCVMKITRSLVRTPLMVKPMFGNTDREGNALATNKPSSSKVPPESCPIQSRSENTRRDSDTKESSRSAQESAQICQSLISPKTLLNGTNAPLWGRSRRSAAAEAVANISSSVVISCPSPHSSSLVLCSTTVCCLSNLPQPNQRSKAVGGTVGLVEEEEGAELVAETEDRRGSYDDVVLEGESETERGCDVWEEADNTHSRGGRVNIRETVSLQSYFETRKMTSEPSTASWSAKKMRSLMNVSEPSTYFAVPETVPRVAKSNAHQTGLKTSLQVQGRSNGPHNNSTTNTPFAFRHKPFISEKTSTLYASFARPNAVTARHTKAPKSSFAIFTDPAKPSSARASENALSSLSADALSSRANLPSVSVATKGGQRMTSPLCSCGRRAKRQVVSNGGPNQGRGFYCCPVRRSGGGGRIQKGCEFFKWESALTRGGAAAAAAASPAAGSSVSLCQVSWTPSCRPPQRSTTRKSY